VVKILSQSGNSLADIYDVEGSIAGIDTLETRELPIVHEMGGTIFSERLTGGMVRLTSTALAQNIAWNVVFEVVTTTMSRVMGVLVFADDSTRVVSAQVSIREPVDGREMPIHIWDSNEDRVTLRMVDDGAAVAVFDAMLSSMNGPTVPSMMLGGAQPSPINEIAFRGLTTGFGAGTVVCTALIYLLHASVTGLSSRGLPLPSW